MTHLPTSATAEEVRLAAGLRPFEWDELIRVTAAEIKRLREADPSITWICIGSEKREQLFESISRELEERISIKVRPEVIAWRVKKTLVNAKYDSRSRRSGGNKASSSTAATSSELPYDPVRDV